MSIIFFIRRKRQRGDSRLTVRLALEQIGNRSWQGVSKSGTSPTHSGERQGMLRLRTLDLS